MPVSIASYLLKGREVADGGEYPHDRMCTENIVSWRLFECREAEEGVLLLELFVFVPVGYGLVSQLFAT